MVRTFLAADPVPGDATFPLLQQFLQRALVVLTRQLELVERILQQTRGHGVDHAEAGVDIDRAEHRLQHIGQQRRPVPPAGFFLPLAEQNVASQVQGLGDAHQPGFADDPGPEFGQFALRRIRITMVQVVAYHQAQDRVAEQFQALVALAAAAPPMAVGSVLQGEVEQPAVAQPHVELAFQLGQLCFSVGIDRGKRGNRGVSVGHTAGQSAWRCGPRSRRHWTSRRRASQGAARWAHSPDRTLGRGTRN